MASVGAYRRAMILQGLLHRSIPWCYAGGDADSALLILKRV